MKKLFIIACLFCITLGMNAATTAAILLLHEGNGTTFDADKLQDAINAAVDGDAIYLSEGTYDVETLNINKEVSIIGTGEISKIRGDIEVGIADNPKLTTYMFDALNIQGDVKVTKELRGLKMRKCQLYTLWAIDTVKDLQLDRCKVQTFLPTNMVKSAALMNCFIQSVGGSSSDYVSAPTSSIGNDLNFNHCCIGWIQTTHSTYTGSKIEDAVFVNCIICSYRESNGKHNSYTNCLCSPFTYPGVDNTIIDCYRNGVDITMYYNETSLKIASNTYFTIDNCVSSGYIGTDGTVVGHWGGSNPYTLEPSGVKITESVLKVDSEKQQLNVTIKTAVSE